MQLYQQQQEVVLENKKRYGNFRGTGSGKTRTTVAIAEGLTLVICPKMQALDGTWTNEWKFQNKQNELIVISKEQFKKLFKQDPLSVAGGRFPDTIIMDEAHTMCGVQPYTRQKNYIKFPKTSEIYDCLIKYIRLAKPKRIHPLTATPAPHPMAVFALSEILNCGWDYWKFRDMFYFEKVVRGRVLFLVNRSKKNKEMIGKLINKLGYTGRLSDFVDVPDQIELHKKVDLTKEQLSKVYDIKMMYPDPLVQAGKFHQLEQGIFEGSLIKENKTEMIERFLQEFGKIVVFAKYTEQIMMYKRYFEKNYPVRILNGKTKDKDRKTIMKEAESLDECLFIAQCSVSAGWELPTFPCMVFASHSYSYVDYDQALGRIQRIHNVKKNIYIDLTGGPIDEKVMATVKSKQDFVESMYDEALKAYE